LSLGPGLVCIDALSVDAGRNMRHPVVGDDDFGAGILDVRAGNAVLLK
jgi:hypothetical protein